MSAQPVNKRLPTTVECHDCGQETGDPEFIAGRYYCDECWADHADEDDHETEF